MPDEIFRIPEEKKDSTIYDSNGRELLDLQYYGMGPL